MVDITKSNFELKYDDIAKAIEKSAFIAFDAEYTCLVLNNSLKPSLFDTGEVRYQKLKKIVTQSSMCQIGISLYIPSDQKQNSYSVQTFNVYLFPQPFGPLDAKFVCQASSVAFLCEHSFDFNKFMYEGVTYLNKDQEENLRKMHQLGRIKHSCDSMKLRDYDQNELRLLLDDISQWRYGAKTGDSREYSAPDQGINQYVLLADLQERFKDVICQVKSEKVVLTKSDDVEKVRKSYNAEFERIFQIEIGFSRVFKKISSSRKPIVGHNCLTDLLFMFEKFHKSLPDNYKDFKKELHNLFPVIFDTKMISFCLRKTMRDETALFNETNLSDLYNMLSSNQGKFYVLYSPFIEHADGFDHYVSKHHLHEAGFDAFLTGYVFIRMAHFMAAKDIKSSEIMPLKFRQQLRALKEFENCINIARASLRYVVIGGDDPPSQIPARFIVCSKGNLSEPLSANEIAHEFLSFGSVDVQMETSHKAIVAVSHWKRAKNVIHAFKRHRKYKVTPYSSTSKFSSDKLMSIGFGIVLLVATGSIVYLLLPSDDS
ncbi:pre-piRNA 3'-exonuclease trimmer-like [Rhopilema esculentum]|uniref:pre-piRNA 3'-exonuclease trimmer-like n=1 Tax=Rhopilema esculentum TaxID=499914 RepID=UPI0031DF2640